MFIPSPWPPRKVTSLFKNIKKIFLSTFVLNSYCCCNKSPQSVFKTTQNYSLTVPEIGSSESVQLGESQGVDSSGSSGGSSALPLPASEADTSPWVLATTSQALLPLSCHFVFLDSDLLGSFMEMVWLPWAYLDNPGWAPHHKTLNLITPAKSLLPYKATVTDPGDFRTWVWMCAC